MSTLENFDPRRFRSTVPYYARYRLGYPDSLIARVAEIVGLRAGDPVMDLGCGPGLLAIPFAKRGMAVLAVDPEPDMLAETRAAAAAEKVDMRIVSGSSYDLPPGIGPFKLVTMGRSFHWMDREATLAMLDGLVTADGALAFFDDHHPPTAENAWRRTLTEIGNRYGRQQSPNRINRDKADFRSVESLLLDSAFPRLERSGAFVRRKIGVEEIMGLARSLSTTSLDRLGDKHGQFEADLREALSTLSPSGEFTELAELEALIARRQ